ncbi:MAG: aspartyl protease family protein [Cyclobacteriaceae bacterium]
MRTLLSFLILLIPGFSLSQTLGFVMDAGKEKVQIPVEVINNLVVVPVVLNGQVPLKFVLDTGVRTTILTQKTYADILELDFTRRYTISGAGGEKLVDAFITNNVSLEIPGINGTGHAMLVLENDYLEMRNYLGADVQGILGYELFSRFTIEFDYERKRITIWKPEHFKPRRSFQSLPIAIQDTKPYVNVTVEQKANNPITVKLLMDTGASHGLILDPESSDKIFVPEKNINSIIGRGLGGVITGKIGRIHSLRMGKYELEEVLANFPDPNSYTDTLLFKNLVKRNGSLGGEIMSRYRLIFDYPRERVYFKKNASFKRGFNYNMSGLTVKAKGARLRTYEITDIREDSPGSHSGLLKGDLLLTINGLPATALDLNTINGFFNSKPGKRITLEIMRGDQRMQKEFKLEDPI